MVAPYYMMSQKKKFGMFMLLVDAMKKNLKLQDLSSKCSVNQDLPQEDTK